MYNHEILEKIVNQFNKKRAKEFCEIVSILYDIKFKACKLQESCLEFDYERQFWWDNYKKLQDEEII